MDLETATNLVEGDDTLASTVADEAGVEAEGLEPELDEEGNPIAREPDDEEIELDDLKLKVPKDQAQKVKEAMLRHADYTRKTQEVAELRKAVEAERQTLHQASQAEIGALAQVTALDQQIAQFQNVDWDAWEETDPFAAAKGARQLQQLRDARGQAAGQYVGLQRQRTETEQRETATRLQEASEVLSRDIKDWSPELGAKLKDFGVKQYGFTAAELDEFSDPRMVKVLHAAFEGHQASTKTQQAQKHLADQTAKPAAKPGKGSTPPVGLDDRLSADEWIRRRNAQTRKRA